MKAVILAGGEGARLRPLTCDRPKPMVPVMNVPVMEHIIALLRKYNFKDIAVTLQYLPDQIRHYFRDGRDFGVSIEYYIEDSPLGTAGSVKNAEAFLDETFLVISGDALTDFNLENIVEFHRRKQGIATIVLTRQETPLEYGVVITDETNRIVRFLEKPGWNEVFSDTVNTGIYVLEPRVFCFFDRGVKFDFSKDLFPLLMAKNESLYGFTSPGYWCDIGTITQYRQAHKDILDGRVKINLNKEKRDDGVWVGRGVKIERGARVEGPVFLGDGCWVRKGAVVKDYTVLGNNTLVETDSS
ncbi:MAG TPA: NDP-sugar synthase, partial [Firmicutes bacterium]|nr:NDP-sugar synthase [Bacillota bacterium]